MADTVIETITTATQVVNNITAASTVVNAPATATVIEVPGTTTEVTSLTSPVQTVDVPATTAITLEIEDIVYEVATTTGPTGYTPQLYSGAAPPSDLVGTVGDLYLVNTGVTIGDLYQKDKTGWGTSKGNLRGGIASINGLSGTNVTLSAANITTGVLPIAQVPTGTSGTTVALGNHLHTGVYEPVIASGLTTQFWRGDKSWVVIDKTSLGLSNVVNVDTSNATNISSGTLAIGRIPTGTTGSTVALGNHNHDTAYVGLAGAQTIGGAKTFDSKITVAPANQAAPLDLKGGAADQVFIQFYGQAAAQSTRSAYVGYGTGGNVLFGIVNERTNGGITLTANGTGVITLAAARVDVGTALATPTLRVGTSTTSGYVLTADASGNATWQQTANIIVPGTITQYYRGDLSWQTLDKAAVGLGNVVNSVAVDLTTNQTIAGTKSFSAEIVGPASGNVLKVGDDARIADVNLANYIAVIGIQSATDGGIAFGGSAGFRLGGNSTGAGTITAAQGLTVTGALTVTGTISGPGSGLTALPAASLTGTIAIARIPVGTTGSDVAAGNHAHTGVYEPVIASGTTAQYWRGDKTMQTLNAAAVGLGNVANVVQVDLTSGQTITGAKTLNNASNVFTGNGAALTALNATQLTSGIAPQARVTPNTQRFVFTTGSEARPTNTTYVEWIGPVQPTNATTDDIWTDTSVGVIEDPVVSMPIGTIQMYASSTSPTNWLVCNGQAVNRVTYSVLFALVGTTYGVGDGSSTFNLPNLQGKAPFGYMPGNTKFDTMGETGGAETVTLTTTNLPNHAHTGTVDSAGSHTHAWTGVNDAAATSGASGNYPFRIYQDVNSNWPGTAANISAAGAHTHTFTTSGTTGATNTAVDKLPPYVTVNFIIKVL